MPLGFRLIFPASLLAIAFSPACQTPPAPAKVDIAIPPLEEWQELRQNPAPDWNALLVEMERYQQEYQAQTAYWALFGECSLAMAAQELAAGRTQGLEVLYADAMHAYQTAAQLEPTNPHHWWLIAYTARQMGNSPTAWEAAQRAQPLLMPDTPWAGRIREEIGRAGLAMVMAAVQAGQALPAAGRQAEFILREGPGETTPQSHIVLSDLLAWQGRRKEAVEPLAQALIQNPQNGEARGRLENLASGSQTALVWDRVRTLHPQDPTVLWYLGSALWERQIEARQLKDFLTAEESLDRAEECFLSSMALNESYRETCLQWLHVVRTGRGWSRWEEGQVADAAEAFLLALEADATRVEKEPTARTLSLGIYSVVGNAFQENRLKDAHAMLVRIFAVHKDNPDWTNNLGFASRDLGVSALENSQNEKSAEFFQTSWQAYSRTVELSPDDVRLVNDRALIAVYYLNEHHELAEKELHRAIQMGDQQLAEQSDTMSHQEKQNLDEAIGDAWENLAYLDVMRRQRMDRAETFLQKSASHYPFERRSGVLRIRQAMSRP